MRTNPKNIFLIDGLGALLTAFIAGVILIYFNEYVGMPHEVLCILAGVACILAAHSLICYFKTPNSWRPFLVFIAISNGIYCCVSMGCVVYFAEQLTPFGITYFVAEVITVSSLTFVELRIAFSRGTA